MNIFFKKIYQWRYFFSLSFILCIAAILRLYHLGTLPLNIHVDEVMNGYVGRFILENGVDLYGNKWPILYFNNFGDYPNVLPMYVSGIFTYVFGVTEFAVRFPIAVFGVLGVWLVYLITRQIFQSKTVAVLTALGLAIMPWHIVLSRATAEGITASSVFLFGLWVFFLSINRKSIPLSLVTIGVWLLTYLLYPSYRVIIPLVLLPTFLLVQTKKQKWVMIIGTLFAFSLTMVISQTTWGRGRFEQTSGFEPLLAAQSTYIAQEGNANAVKARVLFNKPVMLGREFLYQYGTYFSPQFLFAKGGLPIRYAVPDSGLWYYSYAGLLGVAGVILFSSLQKRSLRRFHHQIFISAKTQQRFIFLIWLLLLAPLAAALTHGHEVPNIHRAALMGPILVLISGYGWAVILEWQQVWRRIICVLLFVVIAGEFLYFGNMYAVHSSSLEMIHRSSEMKNLAHYLAEKQLDYDQIYIETRNEAPIFYLFFNQIFNQDLSHQFHSALMLPDFQNLHFDTSECISPYTLGQDISHQHSLFIVRYTCFNKEEPALSDLPQFQQIDSIMSLNPQPIELMKVYELPATASAEGED